MPNYWLIIHDPISFQEHNNLIGCRTKPGSKEPKHRMFGSIASGDLIVYYATVINAVVGTFEVIAGPEYRENDEYWGSSVVYKIVPRSQPVNGFYLDFKKFVTESGAKLSPFPDKKIWFRYIQGKVIRTLTSTDFELITSELTNKRFLSPIKDFKIQPSRWRKRQMVPKVTELIQGSPHQQLKEMAGMLGKICGFDTASEVPLHLVNPEVPKEVANRTVDVVWKLGKYLTIPIEIQVHGSPDAIVRRLKNVEPTSYKMIVIGEEKELDAIKADMEYTETRSFKDKVLYVDQEELFTVKRALQSIWIFRKSLGL